MIGSGWMERHGTGPSGGGVSISGIPNGDHFGKCLLLDQHG